jgi:hypothetical protein
MNISENRIGKTELAYKLGGAYISPTGQINSRKLRELVCEVLNISENNYKKNHVFTASQIEVLKKKKLI